MKIQMVGIISVVLLVQSILGLKAEEPVAAAGLTPSTVFTEKDFPELEPGKPLWDGTRGFGVTYYDKWVYALSRAESILQFECDPLTGKLTYKGAIPLGYHSTENEKKVVQIYCWIRKGEDGRDRLVVFYGNDIKGVSWYGINKSTGVLTPEGQEVPAKCDHHNSIQLMTPDQQHFCYGGRLLTKVFCYRFDQSGVPVPDWDFDLKTPSVGNMGMGAGCIMASPDWSQIYSLAFQCPDKDPKNDKIPLLESYGIDLKSHVATYLSSLELPAPESVKGRLTANFVPFSPDGKFTYVFFSVGETYYYYILARDTKSGALTVAGKSNPIQDHFRVITGPPWGRQNRCVYTADGRNIYCALAGSLGHLSRDLTTGELKVLPMTPDAGVVKLALDPVHGILFTVGEKIGSYKVGGTNH